MESIVNEIFLSYSHKNKDDINELYDILTKKYKLSLWKDTQSIRTGDDFREEIHHGILNAKIFLSCLSKDYIESKNCIKELKLANSLEKKCLLLVLESIDIEKIPSISMLVIGEQRCHIYNNRKNDPKAKLWTGEIFEKFIDDIGLILGKDMKKQALPPRLSITRAKETYNACLSYNIEMQPTIQSLHQQLECSDFKVNFNPIDKNEPNWKYFMKRKDAVDSSTIFISCVTSSYLANENCLNEIEYAKDTNKPKMVLLFENISNDEMSKLKGIVEEEIEPVRIYEDKDKGYLCGCGEQFQQLASKMKELVNKHEQIDNETEMAEKIQIVYDLFVTCDDEELNRVTDFLEKLKNTKDMKIFHDPAVANDSKKRKPHYDEIKKSETVLAIVSKNFSQSDVCVEELSYAYRNKIPTNILIDEAVADAAKSEELNEIIIEIPEDQKHKDMSVLSKDAENNPLMNSLVDELKRLREPPKVIEEPPKVEEPPPPPTIQKEKTIESIKRISSAASIKRVPSAIVKSRPQTPQHMPFHEAADKGNLDEIKYWLSAGKNINEKDARGMTVLHIASREGHLDMVKYLVDQNADRDEKDSDGRTPLHLAATDGRLEVVEYLCKDCKLDFNAKDWRGLTPLHLAAQWGYADIVTYLCEKGANVNEKSKDNWTPLYLASSNRRDKATKILRINGAR